MCPVGGKLYPRVTLQLPVNKILSHSKSITAPQLAMKSVPTRAGTSVRSERTRNVCLNSYPFNMKETDCCPLVLGESTVTPYGPFVLTLKSLLDTPGWIIDTFEPVSKIRLLDIPCIFTEIVDVPWCNKMETCRLYDSIIRGVEMEGTFFIHTSFSFP
jgi:hypothetical protein